MSAEKVTEKAIDVAADVAAGVSDQARETEQFIRSLNRAKVQFYSLGMVVGGITGAVIAYKIANKRAEVKYSKIAEEEIAEMREHYRKKTVAAESEAAKRPLNEIVKEQGYISEDDTPPPMAVPPPLKVVVEEKKVEIDIEDEDDEDDEDDEPEVRNVFREAEVTHVWDWHEERRRRSPDIPYVIHYDERHELEYDTMDLTYYEGDDVLCNERDEVIDPNVRDAMVGDKNLDRFGHGSNDANVVYIRNDKLELVFQISKSPSAYAEEVHGFSHDAYDRGNLERMRAKERHAQEE